MWKLWKVKIFTVTLIVLPNVVVFFTLTSPSLLFCLFLYICNVIQLEFSPQNGDIATEAPPSGCYQKSIRVSPLGLLYSLAPLKVECAYCYNAEWELLQSSDDSACAAGNWTNHSSWFVNQFTGLPAVLTKPLNRIDSKEWIIREWASLIPQRKVDDAFGINWSIFNLYCIKIK